MAQEVTWSHPAFRDLQEIRDYIARDSEYYAAGFVRRIVETARSLGELPRRGRVVPELGDDDIREIVVGAYRLVYEVSENGVAILGVLHGARDFGRAWGSRERPGTE